jgi:hypothetical protein
MLLTVHVVLALGAFVCAVLAGMSRVPLWVSVLLLSVLALLQTIPLGR